MAMLPPISSGIFERLFQRETERAHDDDDDDDDDDDENRLFRGVVS